LEALIQHNPSFNRLLNSLNNNPDVWLSMLNAETPEEDIPKGWLN